MIGITGGEFDGPLLRGKVLPGGADWQIVHEDGTATIDTRYTLETHDGGLVYVAVAKVLRVEELEQITRLLRRRRG